MSNTVSSPTPRTQVSPTEKDGDMQITVSFSEEERDLFFRICNDAKREKRSLAAQIRYGMERFYAQPCL